MDWQRRSLWLSGLLLFTSLWPHLVAAQERTQTGAQCRCTLPGITYCVEDGGRTHVLGVDLSHPQLRVQTVMANDLLDVRPPDEQRERVVDMARRYRTSGAVIAINGDYFGAQRGPEGPTVVQGQRLDTPATIYSNPSRYRRTTLAVARFAGAAIAQLNPRLNLSDIVYETVLFNAISGGPIILSEGVVRPEAQACWQDRIPAATCRRTRQTAAGVDASGRKLWLVVSTARSTGELASLLRDYGAVTAMKLDGGGSSQLWYNGRTLLDADRGVANALLVFVEDRPRHAAQLTARLAIPILTVNEQRSITLTLRNIGFLDWQPARGYGLRLINGATLIDRRAIGLPFDLAPDEDVTLTLSAHATNWPGIYESTWRMTGWGEDFGATVPLRVIVLPEQAGPLRTAVEAEVRALARLSDSRFTQEWLSTAHRIRQLIKTWQAYQAADEKRAGVALPVTGVW